MATKQKSKAEEVVEIIRVERGTTRFCLLGESPFISNAMSNKVRQDLLFPPPKKNAADKASSLKHVPSEEYRRSMYRARSDQAPTEVVMPAIAFKKAMMGAGLDLPGIQKTQIGRLTYVIGDQICIYGVPQLKMDVVRQAGMNRTPDVRTRAIFPEWAAIVDVAFTMPILKQKTVQDLLAAAGITQGIGDYRIEKGAGNYGGFSIVNMDDPQFMDVIAEGGRDAQLAAIASPEYYDSETQELMDWYSSEVKRRGFKSVA